MLQSQIEEEQDNYTNKNYIPIWDQQQNESLYLNDSNTTNTNISSTQIDMKSLYLYTIPALLIFCIISIAYNIRILISIYWIRRPLTPTLHISLSLAGADSYTSFAFGIGLVINSLLPIGFNIRSQSMCFAMFVETQRLAGVIITVAHLLTLAFNHYLGILKPLHYLSIMTHRNTTACISLLWILPITFFIVYFSSVEGEGFQSQYCLEYGFIQRLKFRSMFSVLFFVPLGLMIFIYLHIFIIVREHQVNRERWSQINHGGSRHQNPNANNAHNSNQQQMVKNVKAVYTTLFILGSFAVGWLPAVLGNILYCNDCVFKLRTFDKIVEFGIFTTLNFLIIVKTLLNPIIYAARMQEIKMAIPRMHASLCRRCCIFLVDSDSDSLDRSHQRLSQYYGSNSNHLVRSSTAVYRMHSFPTTTSNGNPQSQDALQRRSTRGHYSRRRRDDSSTEV
ncbi:hypothetical protein C0J52_07093 [Blattella germanica]|nr:hypothetical protein C0J52_07093 [Blattella germanica]